MSFEADYPWEKFSAGNQEEDCPRYGDGAVEPPVITSIPETVGSIRPFLSSHRAKPMDLIPHGALPKVNADNHALKGARDEAAGLTGLLPAPR